MKAAIKISHTTDRTNSSKIALTLVASFVILSQAAAFCSPTYSVAHLPLSLHPKYDQRRLSPAPTLHRHQQLQLTSDGLDASTATSATESTIPNNPLTSAGLSFISASTKSLGMLFYNIGGMDHKEIQALLLQAGTALVSAGSAWETDWTLVTYSMEDASKSFYDISNVFGSANIDESLELALLFERIGKELEDISTISGCVAIGPPSSCSNLFAVEKHLMDISTILKKNSVAATDEHMMCTLFKEVAELFRDMGERYIDETGQENEVSV